MREKCDCTVVQSGPWMVPKPNTAWSLGSASWLAKLSKLARKLTAALSTGNLDDATGSINDIRRFLFERLSQLDSLRSMI